MQILHPFAGSIKLYANEISDSGRYRPDHCPQCEAKQPLTSHGFYQRTVVDVAFDSVIRVRRYLCRACKRTVSLLPEFVLPWLRFSIFVIALFLIARLLNGLTLAAAALAAGQATMPYQRGQFWIRRFQKQAPTLSLALAARRPNQRARSHLPVSQNAGIDRLDHGSPLSVFPVVCPPARLAQFSRSGWTTRHAGRCAPERLRSHTHHLHSGKPSCPVRFMARRLSAWMPKPKNSHFSVTV
jgi:Domain of unknown function (DUF6431)